jgi:hypothetical protein
MKKFLFAIVFLLSTFIGFGQCPTETTWLQTQEDVDNFAIDYPNCTQLTHNMIIGSETSDVNDLSALSQLTHIGTPVGNGVNLLISGTNLNSLSGLDNLEYVGGSLNILDTGITNLTGLENLTYIRDSFIVSRNLNLINFIGVDVLSESGSLSVTNNISQTSFEGMEAFQGSTYVAGDIQIVDLDNLISIEGLNNVSQIRQLTIVNCDALLSLDPFENLSRLGSVIIQDNDSLASITGLSNVDPETVYFPLSIRNCPNLSYCSINLFCENFNNTNPNVVIFIENNASGCDSPQEVAEACGVVLSINELDMLQNEIKTFPNPVTNTLTLLPSGNIQLQSVQVISTLGEQLLESKTTDLDFSNFSNGIYFLKVDTDKGSITKKIVKQ